VSGFVEYIVVAGCIWLLLIFGWWIFWIWYSDGKLRPTSWLAIATMPIWSVRSVWAGWRRQQQYRTFGGIQLELRALRASPPPDPATRIAVVEQLEDGLRTAPADLPESVRADFEKTIRVLREESP